MTDREDAYWAEAARLGSLTGHVVCRCPDCGQRCLVSYSPPSVPWPRCRVCLPPMVEIPTRWGEPRRVERAKACRVVPVGDPSLTANKRPGQPRSARALRAAGLVVCPPNAQDGSQCHPAGPEAPEGPGGFTRQTPKGNEYL
jgi:hypothetical protein